MGSDRYIPALGYRWLTKLYDPVARWATRERTFKAALLEISALRAGERLLDIGCGTGTFALMAASHEPRATIVGLDGDPDVLARARRKALVSAAVIEFDHGLVDCLPYPDESFDIVVSSLVFHHLSSELKRKALAEALRVLRPGGRLCLADWGKPPNVLLRVAFLPVQMLDGFATTRDNFAGSMPRLISEAGFARVGEASRFATLTGSLAIWHGEKPP